jgi:hypothetical protein
MIPKLISPAEGILFSSYVDKFLSALAMFNYFVVFSFMSSNPKRGNITLNAGTDLSTLINKKR